MVSHRRIFLKIGTFQCLKRAFTPRKQQRSPWILQILNPPLLFFRPKIHNPYHLGGGGGRSYQGGLKLRNVLKVKFVFLKVCFLFVFPQNSREGRCPPLTSSRGRGAKNQGGGAVKNPNLEAGVMKLLENLKKGWFWANFGRGWGLEFWPGLGTRSITECISALIKHSWIYSPLIYTRAVTWSIPLRCTRIV